MKQSSLFYVYYDTLFQKKDYDKEIKLIFSLAKKNGIRTPQKLLEIGCGTGNHTLRLSKYAKKIVAIDIDSYMIKIIQEKCKEQHIKNVQIYNSSVEHLQEKNFDIAVALFNVIGYITSFSELTRFMKGVRMRLAPGGLFFFDCWNGVAAILDPPTSKKTAVQHNGKKLNCMLTSKTDFFHQVTTLTYAIKISDGTTVEKGVHSFAQTLWTPMQIDSAIYEAGLEIISCFKVMQPKKKASEKDWKIMYCLRKN